VSEPESIAHDRAREGLDHLQAAARELIAAARAALDVAEDLIDDPDTIASVVGAAGHLGGLGDAVRTLVASRRDVHRADAPGESGTDTAVQRIKVV
jgi:hypothetical protein